MASSGAVVAERMRSDAECTAIALRLKGRGFDFVRARHCASEQAGRQIERAHRRAERPGRRGRQLEPGTVLSEPRPYRLVKIGERQALIERLAAVQAVPARDQRLGCRDAARQGFVLDPCASEPPRELLEPDGFVARSTSIRLISGMRLTGWSTIRRRGCSTPSRSR